MLDDRANQTAENDGSIQVQLSSRLAGRLDDAALDCRNVCSRVVLVRRCPPVDQPFHGVEPVLGPVVAQQLAQCAKAGEAGFNQWIERNLAKPVIGLVVVYVSGVGVSDPASDGNVTLLEAKKSLHAAGQGLKNLFVSLVKSNF